MQHQPELELISHQVEAIGKVYGFSLLGDIEVTDAGRVVFPSPPIGGGLYLIMIRAGGYYIGECKSYGPETDVDGNRTFGRFKNYTDPADDIWTELVINAMLRKGRGGKVYLLPMIGNKSDRTAVERRLITDFRKRGVLLWNSGVGRDEKTYWSYKMAIFESTHTDVVSRYMARTELTRYASKRLADHQRWAPAFRTKAGALGLSPEDYIAVDGKGNMVTEPYSRSVEPFGAVPGVGDASRANQKAINEKRESILKKDGHTATASIQDLVHDYRARHPDASKAECICQALPYALRGDAGTLSTVATLYADFNMTLEALAPGYYIDGERKTLTIRRSVCRLWQQHRGIVTAKMVEQDLRAEGHQRNARSIQQITANVKSAMRALEAVGRL